MIWLHYLAAPTFPAGPAVMHAQNLTTVASVELDGRQAWVARQWDGTVVVVDEETEQPLAPAPEGFKTATVVTVAEFEGSPVIVGNVGQTSAVQAFDLTGRPLGPPLTGHTAAVTAIAVADVEGQRVIISGSADETIRLWDARGPVSSDLGDSAPDAKTSAIALADVAGSPMVVSHGWRAPLTVWDLDSGRAVREPTQDDRVQAMSVGVVRGVPMLVTSSFNEIRLRDLSTGEQVGPAIELTFGAKVIGLVHLDGRPVVVSMDPFTTWRAWDAITHRPIGHELHVRGFGDWMSVTGDIADVAGQPMIISRGELSGKKVKVWALSGVRRRRLGGLRKATELRADRIFKGPPAVAVRIGLHGDQFCLLTGNDTTVSGWDLQTGQRIFGPLTGHTSNVTAVDITSINGRELVVSGSEDETVRAWDPSTADELVVAQLTLPVRALACRGSTVVVATDWGLTAIELNLAASGDDRAIGAPGPG